MKAAVYYENGAPEVFRYETVPTPTPGDEEILIEIAYVSIEGGDLISREFTPLPSVPHIVGYQCSGVVVDVGKSVTRFQPGDRVVTIMGSGSHAEFAVAPERDTWHVPTGLSMSVAAAIPVSFGTAHECLFSFGGLEAGQTVLVHAAAGALGLAAVQLAKGVGARVFATASDDKKLARLSDFGVSLGINYKTDDFVAVVLKETGGKGVDLVIDSIGGTHLARSVASLKYRGKAIMVGVSGRDMSGLDLLSLWPNCTTVQGVYFPSSLPHEHERAYAMVDTLLADAAARRFEVVIDSVFPLTAAALAHRHVLDRKAFGRVLLKP